MAGLANLRQEARIALVGASAAYRDEARAAATARRAKVEGATLRP